MGLFNRTAKSAAASSAPAATAVFDAGTSAVEDISGDYTLDITHTRIGFSARHAMVTTVRGQFASSRAPRTSTRPTRRAPAPR